MKKKELKKSDIFYLVILILSLMIMISSITIAYFSMVASQEKDDTKIYTGNLIIEFIDGKVINDPTLIPRYEPKSINDTSDVYVNEFSIESKGTLDQYIDIYMDVIDNEFENGSVKYILFNDKEEKISKGSINDVGSIKINEKEYLKSGDNRKYTLMLWLEENGENQDHEKGKKLKINLGVEAIQKEK